MSIDLSFKHYREAGKEKINPDPEFDFYAFERINDNGDILLKGSLTKVITRGKKKGEKKWIPGDEQKIVMTKSEVLAWCESFERETRKCGQCFGEGQVMKSWSALEGTKYKKCKRCGGSGRISDRKAD